MRIPREPTRDDPHADEVQDTEAEVDAAFRTMRRIAVTYFVVFLVVLSAFPLATVTLSWWTESSVIGNLSPAFLTAAVGLYVVFAVIGIAAATLSSSVESRMLGHQHHHGPALREGWGSEPEPGAGGR